MDGFNIALNVVFQVHRTVKLTLVGVHRMIFPDSVKWRRTYLPLELWLFAIRCDKGP